EERVKEAREYLDLAGRLLRSSEPRLLAIGGVSGTGKSTLAYGLAPSLGGPPGARVLRRDVLRKRLMRVEPETRLLAEAYSEDVTRSVYAMLGDEASRLLRSGRSVILDAVFLREEERRALPEIARVADVDFTGLWLEAAPDVLERRIAGRRGDA